MLESGLFGSASYLCDSPMLLRIAVHSFFIAVWCPSVWIYHNVFIHRGIGGCLGRFRFMTVMNQPAMNFLVHVFWWTWIWFNFTGYLQNSFSIWSYQKLHFNAKVRSTFNEKVRSLRIKNITFPETILIVLIILNLKTVYLFMLLLGILV